MKFTNGIDLVKRQIKNFIVHIIAGDESSPVTGQMWYNSATNKFRGRNNAANVTFVNDGGDLTAGSVANTALATNPLDRGNHTSTQLASTISDFDTQVRTSRLDQMAVPTADVNLNSRKITNLANGSANADGVNLLQVNTLIDAAVAGLDWKGAVRVATTGPGTLATSFANGQVVDDVTLVTGDRILLKDQASGSENGIRIVAASGAPARAADANTSALIKDMSVLVAEGTGNGGSQWKLTTDNVTLDTTALTFVQHGTGSSTYTAGNGLTLAGNDFNVGAGTGISVAADSVAIDTAVVVRKFSGLFGNNSLTDIPVTHNLGTKDVTWSIRDTGTDEYVQADPVATSVNVTTFTFGVAPTTNQYQITMHA